MLAPWLILAMAVGYVAIAVDFLRHEMYAWAGVWLGYAASNVAMYFAVR